MEVASTKESGLRHKGLSQAVLGWLTTEDPSGAEGGPAGDLLAWLRLAWLGLTTDDSSGKQLADVGLVCLIQFVGLARPVSSRTTLETTELWCVGLAVMSTSRLVKVRLGCAAVRLVLVPVSGAVQ